MESKEISVVVGLGGEEYKSQRKEREALAKKIKSLGFEIETTEVGWPRDHYIFEDGKYVIKKDIGPCGEGGCFRFGKNIVLVSERLFGHYTCVNTQKIYWDVNKFYPNKKIYILPTGYNSKNNSILRGPSWVDHIDLTCLIIPSKNLFFVDKRFYDYTSAEKAFKEIAKQENLELEFYEPNKRANMDYYPLNCLLLPSKNGEEIILANKKDKYFLELLKKHKLNFEEISMSKTPTESMGSINCCTNTKYKETPLDELLDFD